MTIEAILGDITVEPVDAIVNAANGALRRGAGVCGAIFAAAISTGIFGYPPDSAAEIAVSTVRDHAAPT